MPPAPAGWWVGRQAAQPSAGNAMTGTDADRGAPAASALAPALIAAYRATRYAVDDRPVPFVLVVDEPSAALATCHRRHGVHCSAFLTAWNPHSQLAPADRNAAAGAALEQRLHAAGYRLLAGRGVDPSGAWPAEHSVLALGLERAAACAIAREFGQAALVVAGADAVPRLVLLE
jgi:hypothetical protein